MNFTYNWWDTANNAQSYIEVAKDTTVRCNQTNSLRGCTSCRDSKNQMRSDFSQSCTDFYGSLVSFFFSFRRSLWKIPPSCKSPVSPALSANKTPLEFLPFIPLSVARAYSILSCRNLNRDKSKNYPLRVRLEKTARAIKRSRSRAIETSSNKTEESLSRNEITGCWAST